MDIVFTPTGLPVDSATDLESARDRAHLMCLAFGDLYRAAPDVAPVIPTRTSIEKMREALAIMASLEPDDVEYEQITPTAVRERDLEDFIPKDRYGNEGETKTFYKMDDVAVAARWGKGKESNRRIRIQDEKGRWVVVCKSTRKSRRGARIDGGIVVKPCRLRASERRDHKRSGSKLPFKQWLKQNALARKAQAV